MTIADQANQLSSSKRLLFALDEALAKIEATERSKNEPIAVIGMGCRFPGGANNPETLWQLLCDGLDATREVPQNAGTLILTIIQIQTSQEKCMFVPQVFYRK